ncbi:MAG: hypothetical protein U1C74_09985 [Phenylobacterium sp.]|nr:hypothetical protein [Phenylobacterium sp.]
MASQSRVRKLTPEETVEVERLLEAIPAAIRRAATALLEEAEDELAKADAEVAAMMERWHELVG